MVTSGGLLQRLFTRHMLRQRRVCCRLLHARSRHTFFLCFIEPLGAPPPPPNAMDAADTSSNPHNDDLDGGGVAKSRQGVRLTPYMRDLLRRLYDTLDDLPRKKTRYGVAVTDIYANLSFGVGVPEVKCALQDVNVLVSKALFNNLTKKQKAALQGRKMGGIFSEYYIIGNLCGMIYNAAFGGLAAAASFEHDDSSAWSDNYEEYSAEVVNHKGCVQVTLDVAGNTYDVFLGSLCVHRLIVVHYEEEPCTLFQ